MKSLKQKEYLLKLKDEINEFIENFKKRYQLFPWNKVNKLSKFEINSDKPITVNETKFTVKELVKEINKIKGNLQTRMRASYYNFILKAFIKDSIHCTDDEIKNLYHQYQNELKSNFNESKQDLMFCLEALKQINKAFKNDDKEVTESEKVTKTDIFNAVKSYLSKHPDENIKLLSSPKIHTSKNNEEWLLLATLNGDNYKDTCKKLGKEIKVNNENLVFYRCYLPGDVFLFVKMNEVVTESVVFDEKDFKQKVDSFGKSSNIIFIAGLSGSGKSTLAAEYAKKYNAVNIELDLFEQNNLAFDDKNPDEGNQIIKEYFVKNFGGKHKFEISKNPKGFGNEVGKFIKYLISYANSHKDKNFVVEGIQINEATFDVLDEIKQYPVIIKGTSILHSMERARHREDASIKDFYFQSLQSLKKYLKFYYWGDKYRKETKKYIKESTEVFTERNDEVVVGDIASAFVNQEDLRKVDLLNRQLKSGKITKEDYDKKYNEIKSKSDAEFVPKEGSKRFFDPNKNSARLNNTQGTTDLSKLKKGSGNNQRIDGIADKVTVENLQRHFDICRTTENFNDYKQHHSQICKMCGMPLHSSIAPVPQLNSSSGKVVINFYTEKKPANIQQGSILYHTTKQRGITRLKGVWKSTDGVLYSSMRVYFYIGQPGSRFGGSGSGDSHVYQYTGSINNAFVDPELHGNAVFVETNTSIPVKEIQSNNENIKESEDNTMRNTFVNNKNEIVDLNDFLLECTNDLMEESYDNDVVTEGANLDIRANFKQMKHEYSVSMIKIKKLMKNNKFAEAEEEANKLLVLVKKAKKEVERIDGGEVGSVFFGFFFNWTLTFLRSFALCLIPFVGSYAAAIWNWIDAWKRPIKKIIKSDPLSVDDFNFYKNTAISRIEFIEKSVNKLIENIKEAKKDYEDAEKEKAKEDKAVKESAEFKHMKLSLYEACNKGEITVEEREELLKDIQDKFFIKESASEIPQNGLSNKQKFDQVRKVLYERCSRGEISVSERESLIGKAYDMIFVKEAGDPPTPEPATTPDQATKEVDTKEVEKNVESAVKNNSAEINKSLENAVK